MITLIEGKWIRRQEGVGQGTIYSSSGEKDGMWKVPIGGIIGVHELPNYQNIIYLSLELKTSVF